MKLLAKTALMVFLSFLLVGSAQAMSGKGHHGKMGHFKKMMEKLDLTDDQKQQVKSVFKKFRETHKEQRQQMRSEKQALRQLVRQDNLDEEQLRQQFRKTSSLRENLMVDRARMMHEVRSILTDEQKARWEELRKEWKEKHRHKKHGQES